MIALIQRVTTAEVRIDDSPVGRIDHGLLVLIGVENGDSTEQARRLAERVCGYRVFPDDRGRMNLNVVSATGGLLLVPQFTLAADTDKGMRPSFGPAAEPEAGKRLFDEFCDQARTIHSSVQLGVFGADMQVSLVNDGPVTFWLRAQPGV